MQGIALSRHTTLKVILAFACVYLFWGSSFVAIRYSVQMVHPAFVAGIRYLIAGLVLLGYPLHPPGRPGDLQFLRHQHVQRHLRLLQFRP